MPGCRLPWWHPPRSVALLHAVAVVKVGVFSIFRVITGIFGTDLLLSLNLGTVLCYIAAFTILTASLIALVPGRPEAQAGLSPPLASFPISFWGPVLLSPKGH